MPLPTIFPPTSVRLDSDLTAVNEKWDRLPKATRAVIVALVKAAAR